jgi:hypothetical protein
MDIEKKKEKKQLTIEDFQKWIIEIGKDVNGDLLFSYNSVLHEFFCEFCRSYFPGSLFLINIYNLVIIFNQAKLEFPFWVWHQKHMQRMCYWII